jgi:hypothetical protein
MRCTANGFVPTLVEKAMIVPAGRRRFTSSYEIVKHTIGEISPIVAAQLRKISSCVWDGADIGRI